MARGQGKEDCGRPSKGIYFLPGNLRARARVRFRDERRRRRILSGEENFFNKGGNSRSPRTFEIRGPRRRRSTHRWDGLVRACVCVVGRILRNPSLTAASFLKRSLARRRGVDLAARERRSKFLEAIVKIRLSANFTAVLSATLRAGAYFNRAL